MKKEMEDQKNKKEIKMSKLPNWNVWNDDDIIEMLWYITNYLGYDCADCKITCCASQHLNVGREDIKNIAKYLKMDVSEFRLKHTILRKNLEKHYQKRYGSQAKFQYVSDLSKRLKDQGGRILLFDFSDDDIIINGSKMTPSYCSFYSKETHRCNIYKSRPKACQFYPYLMFDDCLNLQRPNTCLISRNFLYKLIEVVEIIKDYFCTKTEVKIEWDKYKKQIKETLESTEYIGHSYISWTIIVWYLWIGFCVIGLGEKKIAFDLWHKILAENDVSINKIGGNNIDRNS